MDMKLYDTSNEKNQSEWTRKIKQLGTHMIQEHITSGHDNEKYMTHGMVERNPTGQDKIKLGHIALPCPRFMCSFILCVLCFILSCLL